MSGKDKDDMIPPTINSLPRMGCVSAIQKFVRRGMEREAMEMAAELIHTDKAAVTMLCNRLNVICHEDLDTLAAPMVSVFVATATALARDRYKLESPGESRLMIGNCIRMMCRAPKSRAGVHFAAAIGLRAALEGFVPEIPDWVNDQHTLIGKRQGRGIDYFRAESAKLVPPQAGGKDAYEDEAYRLWGLKEKAKGKKPALDV